MTCFITIYLLVLSLQNFILIKKQKRQKKSSRPIISTCNTDFNLLLGINNNNDKVYIPEKGLYQNILITGTIGSR